MNQTGAPADCWLLCMTYVYYLLNHMSCEALKYSVPLTKLHGVAPDISILLLSTFSQSVSITTHNQSFPSTSKERAASWVGFGEHVGDALTQKLFEADTRKILSRSAVSHLELEGHIWAIPIALYGLKNSGLGWAQRIHDMILDMDFMPCKADPSVWFKKSKDWMKYEYVTIYVDDLLIYCEDPMDSSTL